MAIHGASFGFFIVSVAVFAAFYLKYLVQVAFEIGDIDLALY